MSPPMGVMVTVPEIGVLPILKMAPVIVWPTSAWIVACRSKRWPIRNRLM